MKTAEQLLAAGLKTVDSVQLFQLLQEAIDLARFEAGRHALAKGREEKLKDQVARQIKTITQLETALWK